MHMVDGDERSLRAEVAADLAPHLKDALDHPTRRGILRVLNAQAESQTIRNLSDAIPNASISTISYHILTLEKAACISPAGKIIRSRNSFRTYISNVADNSAVLNALRATQQEDSELDG
jgi:DNA-binding transcriptional ArsR family regulator